MTTLEPLTAYFVEIDDPRVERTKEHLLLDIIGIAICAVICGADGWVEIAEFGKAKQAWLTQFLALPNGMPSHDTFGRVFAQIDPAQFQQSFLNWVQAVFEVSKGQVVAIDGKQVRHSYDRGKGKGAIHMVSAWATANQLVLGQRNVDEKSNEITAIPLLLETLALEGCIVTIDAMGCQKEIAKAIVAQEADYILATKANQGHFHQDLCDLFAYAQQHAFHEIQHDYAKTVNKNHGRIEIRQCWVIDEPLCIQALHDWHKWPQLRSLIKIQAERRLGTQREIETRYFISSLPARAFELLRHIRAHWQIENSLHWVLDIAFREDDARTRTDHSAHNLTILRHIALNLLKQEPTAKCGIKAKRLKAGWNEDYLLKVLAPTLPI